MRAAELFDDYSSRRDGASGGLAGCAIVNESPERPPVQQQQHERQRHEHRLGQQSSSRQSAPRYRCTPCRHVRLICQQRQHPEHRRQDVLPLGNPRDGFDAADAPQRSRLPAQRERAGHSKQATSSSALIRGLRIHEVLRAGRCPADDVQHVRQPSQWMPVGRVEAGKCPDIPWRQAALDAISRDVNRIVIADESTAPSVRAWCRPRAAQTSARRRLFMIRWIRQNVRTSQSRAPASPVDRSADQPAPVHPAPCIPG